MCVIAKNINDANDAEIPAMVPILLLGMLQLLVLLLAALPLAA